MRAVIFLSLQEHHLSIIDYLCNQTEGTKCILSSDLHGSGLYKNNHIKLRCKLFFQLSGLSREQKSFLWLFLMELSLDLNIMMIDWLLCLLVLTTHKKYCFSEESIYKLKMNFVCKLSFFIDQNKYQNG